MHPHTFLVYYLLSLYEQNRKGVFNPGTICVV